MFVHWISDYKRTKYADFQHMLHISPVMGKVK
jgi:hypothetical protein